MPKRNIKLCNCDWQHDTCNYRCHRIFVTDWSISRRTDCRFYEHIVFEPIKILDKRTKSTIWGIYVIISCMLAIIKKIEQSIPLAHDRGHREWQLNYHQILYFEWTTKLVWRDRHWITLSSVHSCEHVQMQQQLNCRLCRFHVGICICLSNVIYTVNREIIASIFALQIVYNQSLYTSFGPQTCLNRRFQI